MTTLATCSYAAYRPEMGAAVRITLGLPRWPLPPGRAHWIYLAELAPRWTYFRAEPAVFEKRYRAQLDCHAADIEMKIGWLGDRFGPLCLCCFERRAGPGECHRLLFGRWWTERTGQPVPEMDGRR